MNKALIIAKREYLTGVKTKGFVIGLFLTPLFTAFIFLTPFLIGKATPAKDRNIAIIDLSSVIYLDLVAQIGEVNKWSKDKYILQQRQATTDDLDSAKKQLNDDVNAGRLDAYLIIGQDAIENGKGVRYFSNNVTNMDITNTVRNALNSVVTKKRFIQSNIDPNLVAKLQSSVDFEQIDISKKGKEGEEKKAKTGATLVASYIFVFLLFMSTFALSGQGMLNNVVEEKSNRIFEVLLSSMSSFQLMLGKILGIGGTGLTLVAIWCVSGYVAASFKNMTDIITLSSISYLLVYYIFGFLMFSSFMGAIGSACNTIKDAQGMMTPVSFIMIVPLASWFAIAREPNSLYAVIMSYIPLFTPFVMMIRLAVTRLPFWEIASTSVILLAFTFFTIWASARIFRVGILMYGKQPKLGELLKWVRYK